MEAFLAVMFGLFVGGFAIAFTFKEQIEEALTWVAFVSFLSTTLLSYAAHARDGSIDVEMIGSFIITVVLWGVSLVIGEMFGAFAREIKESF